jgi:hypothetical protein
MTILILGGTDDDHAVHMLTHLQERGVDALLLDSRSFPTALSIAFDPEDGSGAFGMPDRRVPFEQVRSVYWRLYDEVRPPALPDPEQHYIAQNDARGLFESMLIHLPARWVNGWSAFRLHQTKPVQLAIVARLGASIPATIIANDAEAVARFASDHPRAIFKPFQVGAHARRVTQDHLSPHNLERLRIAPVTIQEEILGTNIRVFVAGERVMACEIETEHIDFRDDENPTVRVHSLPADVERMSVAIAGALDLRWTGIDFRRTPEARYVFLEANPSPMFMRFEMDTGLPLTDSLAALLL